MKIRKKFLILVLIILPNFTFAAQLNYDFKWLSLPVAELVIDFQQIEDNKIKKTVEYTLKTAGPLKLYRNYKSSGYIKPIDNKSWVYHITGKDRGQPEEKLIIFADKSAPYIEKFIDDRGADPVKIEQPSDIGAVDPVTTLISTINKLREIGDCDASYFVVDGKRKYRAIYSEIIKQNNARGEIFSSIKDYNIKRCRVNITGAMIELNYGDKKKWPFNSKDNFLTIWFDENMNYLPIKFRFNTPIGAITGDLN